MEVSVIQSNINDSKAFEVTDSEREEKWWDKIFLSIFPAKRQINLYVAQSFIALFLYAILYGMLGEGALPGSEAFAMLVIIIFSILGGKLSGLLHLPPLVGMLLVGFGFRNIHAIPYYNHIRKKTITTLREISLSIILLRAGLGLDGETLKKLKTVVIRLTILPCITEVISMGIFGHYILDLPFIFSFMLGFIISAISPEVVLPPVLELERQKYGVKKGIPALVIGATSLDDILAIAGFTICFSIAFSTKNLTWTIIKAPLEPILGFVFAVLFGVLFWHFPSSNISTGMLAFYNVVMVCFGSMAAMFLSDRLDIAGSGPLTCIILAFVAAIRWRNNPNQFEAIYTATLTIWLIVEPILFSLIGAEITMETLHDNAGYALLSLFLALICRTIMTASVICGANLNVKEKVFICCAYVPKASVQAAIGSQALDYARANNKGEELLRYGLTVLNVCVLSLILTAPVASILINLLGPVLLTKDSISVYPEIEEFSEEEDFVYEESNPEGRKRLMSDYGLLRKAKEEDKNK